MIPQAPVNNQQTWANLEAYGRTLVSQGYEVYIIMGCYGWEQVLLVVQRQLTMVI
jgi:endonuclease G